MQFSSVTRYKPFEVTIHEAARTVLSASCEGDSPIFAAETMDHWAKNALVAAKNATVPCKRSRDATVRAGPPWLTIGAILRIRGFLGKTVFAIPSRCLPLSDQIVSMAGFYFDCPKHLPQAENTIGPA